MSRLDFLYSSDVSSKAVAVFLYLLDHANKQGECWPAIPTIAEDLKISESTVRRAAKELKRAGLLQTEQRFRQNGGKTAAKAVCVTNSKPPVNWWLEFHFSFVKNLLIFFVMRLPNLHYYIIEVFILLKCFCLPPPG